MFYRLNWISTMSREILFRGKRIDNDQWVEGYLIISHAAFDKNQHCIIESKNHFQTSSTKNGNLCYSETDTRVHKILPESVGQFTGLLDKNGKKIFEGDILKCISPNNGSEFISDFIVTLANGITFKNSYLNRDMILFGYEWMEVEIIGNIHDSPELIGKETSNG